MRRSAMETVGRRVFYSGQVQGVGFRQTTHHLARGANVVGFVRNLPNGQVELYVEGTTSDLERFLGRIAERFGGMIETAAVETLPAVGEWKSFDIRR